MEEVAFQDWPGQPVDLNAGNNPWMPAYGLQPPTTLLEKDDFLGNPDAEYFFHGSSSNYMYLETIQEETSDDLQSDSDLESRSSPVRWLATDSESGSVICMDQLDDLDCDSDRELACPPKRRKQDLYLSLANEDNEELSLSRSSSLLQFETLEKECQQESQSPSIFSQFSFDSLELINGCKKDFCLEDSSPEYEGDFFKTLGQDVIRSKKSTSRDSLLYNASTRYSGSDSSDSDTVFDTSRSCDNLKTWRSFDSLPLVGGANGGGRKFSSENLSEDSGYGEQLLSNRMNNLSSSAGNLAKKRNMGSKNFEEKKVNDKKNSYVGFNAYDCDVVQHFHGNFGVSYQDLSIFERYDPFSEPLSKSSPLTDVFLRKKQARQLLNLNFSGNPHAVNLNINIDSEPKHSNFANNSDVVVHAASVPNLLQATENNSVDIEHSIVNVFSVPKDLNFIGEFNSPANVSVAEKNWNLADIKFDIAEKSDSDCGASEQRVVTQSEVKITQDNVSNDNIRVVITEADHSALEESLGDKQDLSLWETTNNENLTSWDMANYKREGSYSEAMRNRVDLSDDESSLIYKKKLPKSPIVEFDKRVLKAISEQSLHSLVSSTTSLQGSQKFLDKPDFTTSTPVKRRENSNIAMSTPDLNRFEPVTRRANKSYFEDERRKSNLEIPSTSRYNNSKWEEERNKNILLDGSDECEVPLRRKESIIKSSTSTSGMSDIDEKTLRNSVKSFSGSTGSKGVHFSPVVAEVNWRDDGSVSTVSPDRESLYSLNSSSPEPVRSAPTQTLLKPKPRYVRPQSRRSLSQPDLSDNETKIYKREFIDSLNSLRGQDMEMSKSQPDMNRLKRRGSHLFKKDKDGCTIKAYVDKDGIQYKHTQLDLKTLSQNSVNDEDDTKPPHPKSPLRSGSKNSSTSKFPFHFVQPAPNGNQEYSSQLSGKQLNAKRSNVIAAMADDGGANTIGDVRSRKAKNKSGLGGFLQRLASFRLGAKKGQEQKDKLKRKTQQAQGNGAAATAARGQFSTSTAKPEYIYIPLKGPSVSDNNNMNTAPVSSKPPLPKQPPPRVVHASVKKAHAQNGNSLEERRRRRTIDSGSVGVESATSCRNRDVGRHGDASMDGPMGLIETDLDTEVTVITSGANAKARSLLDLGPQPRLKLPQKNDGQQSHSGRPHKSMEFLLDKQNLKVVEPPENELQKTERVMSEHELRVQRSLQKLTIPEWYKQSQVPSQGFLLKKNSPRETRWTGTGSKTTSLSSLGSGTHSPVVLSPTPCNQPFVRWSTSKLNSTASSPCQSTRSSFNQGRQPNGSISPSSVRSSFSYRQPYMGWRSQERLNRPRTPAERLASSLLAQQTPSSTLQQESPEIQTSIKEVTSAIVHYVSGLKPSTDKNSDMDNTSQRSSSVSPRGSQKLCWLESSFVGTKPLDSPETPVTCSESPVPSHGLRLDLQNHSSNEKNNVEGQEANVVYKGDGGYLSVTCFV